MEKKLKKTFKFLKGVLRSFSDKEQFMIKKGYVHRKEYTYLDKIEDQTNEWQQEVYQFALQKAKDNNYRTIIDFGCGSAKKLIKYFEDFETIGIEVKESVEKLKNLYPEKIWIDSENVNKQNLQADIVICADVIEHVLNPDEFLDLIKNIDFKFLIISTPDRIILKDSFDYGPPKNPFHIREWSGKEFNKYISKNFNVISHQITNYSQATQMIVCTKNKK